MVYESIEQLNKDFIEGNLVSLPDTLSISNIHYRFLKSSENNFSETLQKKLKSIILYSLIKNESNIENFKKLHHHTEDSIIQDNIAFLWGFKNLFLIPIAVKFISSGRSSTIVSSGIVKNENINEANIPNDRLIGHNLSIIITGFNNHDQIPAKVDTGAQICSLHAENIQIKSNQNMVSFTFGDKKYTMPTHEFQSVQTADNGVENRPVVTFDIIIPNNDVNIKNRIIKKIKFNLNDRSNMPDKILLGQNFIKAGDFVVVSDNEINNVTETILNNDNFQNINLAEDNSFLNLSLLLEISDNISSQEFLKILKLHLPEIEKNKLEQNKKYNFIVKNNTLIILDNNNEIIKLQLKSDKLTRDYAWQSSRKDINPFVWK